MIKGLVDTSDLVEECVAAHDEMASAEPSFPSRDGLDHALRTVYLASLKAEEGKPCRPHLVFVTEAANLPMYRFATPQPLTVESLRELSFMVPRGGAIAWTVVDGESCLFGVLGDPANDCALLPSVRARSTGTLDVAFRGQVLVALRGDTVHVRHRSVLPQLTEGFGVEIGHLFEDTDRDAAKHVFDTMARLEHGGSLWVVKPGANVTGLRVAYRFHEQKWREQSKSESLPFDRLKWLVAMTGVDGAVLVTSRMELLGAGVFSNIGNESTEVRVVQPDGTLRDIPRDRIGGGRHRSAVSFCHELGMAYAMVVSSDGRVTAISSARKGDKPIVCEFVPTEPARGENLRYHHLAGGASGPRG